MTTDSDFFGAAPLAPAVDPNAEHIDLFAQAIAGRFSNPASSRLTAALSPTHDFAAPSAPHRASSALPSPSTPAAPLAHIATNRSTSPRQPLASSSASSFEFTVVTAANVSEILRTPKALVLDIRPHSAYSAARLPHAISLCVPSTLLKRPAFTLQKLATMLPSASARSRFQAWSSASRVLVYDADTLTLTDGSNLLGLLRKFRSAGFTGDIAWLQGGLQAMWKENRHLVEERSLSDDEEDAESEHLVARNLPQAAFQQTTTNIVRPSPGSMTCPSSESFLQVSQSTQPVVPSTRIVPANPFYDNIRQNLELSQGITERIPLRLSPSIVARLKELPFIWLRNIAKSAGQDEGTEALAMQFYRIELGEQRRLQGIMAHHSLQSGVADGSTTDDAMSEATKVGKPFPYSIVAGVEKGTKNRYRNIWPFEHSRVRLRDQVNDDYVNASYVQPLGTQRKYIATQGPLPSTFSDFWSVVWQQEVRLILMLTKVYEGGAIKCGKYWEDGQYGPYHLKCISVSGATELDDPGGGESGGGFFNVPPKEGASIVAPEDKKNDFTIKRVFELSRVAHPELPPRTITQLQYLGWPDMDVPVNPRSLLRLMFDVDEMADRDAVKSGSSEKASPVLLHCSAGVGRTGAFIMIDAALDGVRREIRKRALAKRAAKAGARSAGGSSESDGEGHSDIGIAMEVDPVPFVRQQSTSCAPTSSPKVSARNTVLPPATQPLSPKKDTPGSSVVQTQAGPVATLHIGGKKSGQGDIHVPLVPSNEVRPQGKALSGPPTRATAPSHSPIVMNSLLRRRLSRPLMQRPVKADFTIADADSMFMSPVPNPAFAMDVNPLSTQARDNNNNNSSSGEGTTSGGDKASGSASQGSGSASDGRFMGPLLKTFAGMSSADDTPASPERLKPAHPRHRSDGAGSGEGAGGSASESSAQSSSPASGCTSGGYSSASSLGLGKFAGMNVDSPTPSGYSSPVPSRPPPPVLSANRGRARIPRNMPMQKLSLLAPKPLHLPQMPELTEGVETNIQSAPLPLPSHGGDLQGSRSLSSLTSSSTDLSLLRSTSLCGNTTDTYDTPLSTHKASRSPSADKGPDRSVFDYTEPRELHGDDSPPLLSSLEEPLRQILEDMREQRMSLCQSLRQYVFVHNAIIEGALIVAEDECKRLRVDPREVFDPNSPPPPTDPPMIHLIGKRGASPTELPKEDKKGDVALAKRPSVKRGKSTSNGESTSPDSA